MKLAGTKKYPYGCGSPSDGTCLGYNTKEQAQAHADNMNRLLETFEADPNWNKQYWATKPATWIVVEFT